MVKGGSTETELAARGEYAAGPGGDERMRAIFEEAAIGMALSDPRGRPLECNRALARFLGYDREELMRLSVAKITHPEDLRLDWAQYQSLWRGELDHYQVEKRYIRKDGCTVWGRLNVSMIGKAGSVDRCALVMVEDVTERRAAEEELRAGEERFRMVADFTYDWEDWRDPDGRFIYVSPSCQRITGYHRDEFLADPGLKERIIISDDRPRVERHLRNDQYSPEPAGIDFRIRTRDGRIRWIAHFCVPVFAVDGAWLGRRSSNRDITPRKEMEEQLRENSQRYRALIQGLPVGVLSVDKQMRITSWNYHAETVTGYTEEEVLGRRCRDFLSCEGNEGLCPLAETMERRVAVGPRELELRSKSGRQTPVRIRASMLTRGDGRVGGGVEAFQDISEIKRLESERAQVVSMLAHDMKSPLVSIQGFARRLLERPGEMGPDKRSRYLQIMQKEAGKLEELILDFLDFSRLKSGGLVLNFAPTDLAAELSDLADTFRPRFAQAGLELVLTASQDLPLLQADAPRLRRVFTNLLENAFNHSPDRGRVELSAEREGEEIVIRVADQGPGISPEDSETIFEPFHRGRGGRAYKGHGLGLAGVRVIVEGHGGKVSAGIRDAGGAVFTVILPARLIADGI